MARPCCSPAGLIWYGLALRDWPLIGSSLVTLALMLPILAMKLRYG